jgi:hypothetical protein
MKLKLKEDPKEWRKAVWLSALGLAILATILRWRRVLPAGVWDGALVILAGVALLGALRPHWFRSYYRFSGRMGFYTGQWVGQAGLLILFLLVLTPLGWTLRLIGKDSLRLKKPRSATYWHPSGENTSLDRLF